MLLCYNPSYMELLRCLRCGEVLALATPDRQELHVGVLAIRQKLTFRCRFCGLSHTWWPEWKRKKREAVDRTAPPV